MLFVTWCSVLFVVCVAFLIFIKRWEKKHPQALTSKGTAQEKQQYHKIIMICMSTIFSFVLLFILVIGNIGHQEEKEPIPVMLYLLVGLGFAFIASVVIPLFKKNKQ